MQINATITVTIDEATRKQIAVEAIHAAIGIPNHAFLHMDHIVVERQHSHGGDTFPKLRAASDADRAAFHLIDVILSSK